jgi:hypothetical protein
MQFLLHYSLHFLYPLFVAYVFYKTNWKKTYGILIATMLVDIDHLLATPIFDAHRCSISFHALHSFYVIPIYILLLFLPKNWSLIGLGLCMHMMTDAIDCMLMKGLA